MSQFEEYVKIDDDLSIEEENLHVSNFIHRDTTEALALSEDDDEESPMEDCKIKDYSEALKYSEQLKQFFLNNADSEGLAKLIPMKIHLEKQQHEGYFGTDLVILNLGQMTTPELTPPSPNFHTTPTGGRLATMYDLTCNRPHTRRIFSGIGSRTWNPPAPKPGPYH
ncbi:hypothetical protein AVEN_264508-1 [Araneus ventricosus]|uniref:Uncharacterized protein n=1 Tax=Araneus ventricosus TaxID=182803 RepID=A0A4Y2J801_ARAVE|nr:hypothetical protein AVEN_264508-1 [Araneus ventricosus]